MKFKCLCLAIIAVFVIASNTTAEAGVAAPNSLEATAISKSQINITWRDNSNNESGFLIWRYDSSWSQIADLGANRTSYSDTGLSASTVYRYAVRAYNSDGFSGWSNVVSARTLSGGGTVPAAPGSLAAGAVSSSQINLSWQDNAGDESGFHIWRYDSSWSQIADLGANRTSYSDTGLSASTTFRYAVRAYNSAGISSWSNVVSATTMSGGVTIPTAPSSLTASAVSSSQINLSWQDHANNETDFKVERANATGGPWSQIATLGVNVQSYANTGLSASKTYYYRVRAYNTAGNSSYSNTADATTPAAADTTAPSVSVTSPQSGTTFTNAQSVSITATASDDVAVSKVEFYQNGVLRRTDTSAPYTHSWSITSADNRNHSWWAKAYDEAGNSRTSTAVSLTVNIPVPDTTAPSVSVTSPQTGTTYTSAQTVVITASASDNVAVSKVEFYQNGVLRRSDTSAPYSHSWAINSSENGSHSWTAKAYDAAANNRTSTAISLSVNIGTASGGELFWADAFGNVSDDRGHAVALGDNGHILVAGSFSWTVDFGGGPLTAHKFVNQPGDPSDIFLAKYSPGGGHVWSKRIGGHGDDSGNAIAIDGSGNLVVAGDVGPNVDFGGGESLGFGGWDVFVGKYSGVDGEYIWANRFGSSANEYAYGVAADSWGNVIVTGVFTGTVDFGGGPLTSAGGSDIFVAKYAGTDGRHLWSQRFGSPSDDCGNAVAVDGSDNVVITGYFSDTVDFGGGSLTSAGGFDIFVAQYSASGAHLWSQRFGGTNYDNANGVVVDSSDNVVLTGSFVGTVDFGGGPLSTPNAVGDAFLAKYSASGAHLWSQRLGGRNGDAGWAVAVDGSDNVVVTGSFQNTVDFGSDSLTSAGWGDIFVAKYSASGGPLWSQRFGGTGDDRSQSIAADHDSVVVTGYYPGTVDFGDGALTSAGSNDVFLFSLLP